MTLYCNCETPVMDVEHDTGCRRCGLPVNFTPLHPSNRCQECGGPLAGWAGEHHSPQCSRNNSVIPA